MDGERIMKILIATDGSDFSRKAVEKCCEIVGKGSDAVEIKIISLVERVKPMAAEPFAISGDYFLTLEADLRKQSEKAVAEAEEIIRQKLGGEKFTVEGEVFTGNVKRIIIEEAQKFKADLIVVGSHGYGFFDRMLLGSVSDFVVHHAEGCSVLVVRTKEEKKE
jgi:nucleotide-binding universal stress UspA family protein